MGYCVCTGGIKPTSTNYGGTLNFTWVEGNSTYTWHGPSRYCNPYNCSNSKCKSNGCANAKAGFCARYGRYCPSLKKNLCAGQKCPNLNPPSCVNRVADQAYWYGMTGKTPCICGDPACGGGGGGGGNGGNGGTKPTPKPGGQDPYCKTNCDALPLHANLACRVTKATKGCGGSPGGPPLEGNPFANTGVSVQMIVIAIVLIGGILLLKR